MAEPNAMLANNMMNLWQHSQDFETTTTTTTTAMFVTVVDRTTTDRNSKFRIENENTKLIK